jgi:hypothetical protein
MKQYLDQKKLPLNIKVKGAGVDSSTKAYTPLNPYFIDRTVKYKFVGIHTRSGTEETPVLNEELTNLVKLITIKSTINLSTREKTSSSIIRNYSISENLEFDREFCGTGDIVGGIYQGETKQLALDEEFYNKVSTLMSENSQSSYWVEAKFEITNGETISSLSYVMLSLSYLNTLIKSYTQGNVTVTDGVFYISVSSNI